MSEKINRFLCHKVVQHIKSCAEITFDCCDLEEDFEGVLKSYNWYLVLSEAEKNIIFKDLWDLALRHEMAEVVRSMNPDEFLAMHGDADPLQVCPEAEPAPPCEEPILA